jgi:hypothetical protein
VRASLLDVRFLLARRDFSTMTRLAALSLLLVTGAALAQQPRLTERQRQHVAALGQALAQCHGRAVIRDARTPMSAARIVERALAACAAREAPIRTEVTRIYGPANAPRVLAAQREHYRQGIAQMVARARAAR